VHTAGLDHAHDSMRGLMAYIWGSTAQNAEAVHDTIRSARSEIIARIRFADVSCHGTCEVGICRVCGSEVEVVGSRRVCGDVLVVEFGRELDRAAYTTRSAAIHQEWKKDVGSYRTSNARSIERRAGQTKFPKCWKHQPRTCSTQEHSAPICGSP
jgi:hypothetical protein